MIDVFIGDYTKILGYQVFIRQDEEFTRGIFTSYLFKSKKPYVVKLENGKTIRTNKLYINYL